MINLDEDALICDFAETYNIYNYTALPPTRAAILANGLREDSRIKMLAAGRKASLDTVLLAGITDRLSLIISGDEAKFIADKLIDREQRTDDYGFDSGAEFDAAWAALG